MRLRSKLIGFFSLMLCSVIALETFGQEGNTQSPANNGDREYKIDTVFSARPVREADKMYKISVWRRIDLREKYNLPFYGTGDIKTDGIIGNIYKAVVEENSLEVFADEEFTQPLSISEFQTNFWIAANGDSIFIKNLYYLDFMEEFAFDKHRSEIMFDIKYIELVMPSETNSNAGQESIAFIRYKDFYEHFKDHPEAKWHNFQNTAKDLTYDQAFDLRLFRSVVRKYTNADGALIADMVDPDHPNPELQAYLNSLEFEYDLLEWENTLWEW
ncbi:MAG: gliding motility protein GldN [Anditalea sp.]